MDSGVDVLVSEIDICISGMDFVGTQAAAVDLPSGRFPLCRVAGYKNLSLGSRVCRIADWVFQVTRFFTNIQNQQINENESQRL